MSRRVIDRSEWPSFVDGFSRRHDGWLISVAVEEGSQPRRYLTRDAPLRDVTAEAGEDTSTVMISSGDTAQHATHFIQGATSLEVEETSEGAESALTIADEGGARTILEFRSPMLTELVDGIVS